MKNKAYLIIDKKNDIIVNTFIAIDDNIAKAQAVDSLKKTFYILKNSKNVNEQATLANYINNAKEYTLINQLNIELIKLKDIIEKLEPKND